VRGDAELGAPCGVPRGIIDRMAKRTAKPRKTARPRRRTGAARPVPSPADPFWNELLTAIRDLHAELRRLAGEATAAESPEGRRLDWTRFVSSRATAAEGRERYWREAGAEPAPT